jgi:hypothetical protein
MTISDHQNLAPSINHFKEISVQATPSTWKQIAKIRTAKLIDIDFVVG